MSTARPSLTAIHRDVTGKAVSRLRREGQLPAVVFGNGVASTNVALDAHAFELLRHRTSANTLVDLSIDGKKPRPVLVHGVQLHVVTQRPLHADLYLVRMTDALTVDVPLVPTGESEAVKLNGGTLLHPIEHVRVKALPDHLPQSLAYDISVLVTFDDVVRLRDIAIPADVTLLTDPNEIVARVSPPRVEEEPTVVGAEEAIEAAETAAEGAEASGSEASGSGTSPGD
ncbi:MAG: 50S ribosomal protein L25 [Chloroflexi bacterium]|nr:50S ribosomal protein L25 [Chloroflexota bacterium]